MIRFSVPTGTAIRPAHAAAQAEEDRRVGAVAHGDAGKGDVFQQCAVDAFQREASAAIEDAVGDGDVLEAAIRFGAALDAAGGLVTFVSVGPALPGAVQHRADLVCAGDIAVGDGDILRGARIAQREGTLGADAVVVGRIDAAVGDAHVAAAVDVHAVAVGVDVQVVDGEVVDAGGEDAEPAAFEDGEVAQDHVENIYKKKKDSSLTTIFFCFSFILQLSIYLYIYLYSLCISMI